MFRGHNISLLICSTGETLAITSEAIRLGELPHEAMGMNKGRAGAMGGTATSKAKKSGRKPKMTPAQIREARRMWRLNDKGKALYSQQEIADKFGVTPRTLHRMFKGRGTKSVVDLQNE